MDSIWTIAGVGASPKVRSSEISGEADQELRDHPKDTFSIQGSRTNHRTLFSKWNALAVRSQRIESAYLQIVNLVATKLYDSTQFFRFDGSIYDLSFIDVDKIHPFSNTLEWHSLKSEGQGSNEERLTVKQPECSILNGGLVAESITSLCFNPSSMGHVESRVNEQGPPCKAKYS
ncbi:hypothetical protein HAX54_034848 [Datura stramonium]|uniref:Uncharacterized protein ycf68 n=1 Tax=Datura stramonium TaxID=4076 RepID=A0ABS8VG15_DATST|nr:hypothetical protein [Datura stramonium]